jgi:hypothetical protein
MMKLMILLFFLVFSQVSLAQDMAMKRFLVYSAYGSMIGAGVGLASLAFTESPDKKLNSIARGASLGLYVGMAWGAFGGSTRTDVRSDDYGMLSIPTGFVSLIPDEKGVSVQSNWVLLNF